MKLLNISGLGLPNIRAGSIGSIQNYFACSKYLIFFFTLVCTIFFSARLQADPVKKTDKSPDWFWVFYEHGENFNGYSTVYRPFYLETTSGENMFQTSLMPLFFWRYKNDRNDVTKGFLGFYQSTDYKHSENNTDYDSGFFPLFLYGNGTDDKDDYLFVYPFGGNIRGKLGYERISPYIFPGVALFFLFPPSGFFTLQTTLFALASLIPVYTDFQNKDYRGTAILWPFVAWGGGTRKRISGFSRFMPIMPNRGGTTTIPICSLLITGSFIRLMIQGILFSFFPFTAKSGAAVKG